MRFAVPRSMKTPFLLDKGEVRGVFRKANQPIRALRFDPSPTNTTDHPRRGHRPRQPLPCRGEELSFKGAIGRDTPELAGGINNTGHR